MAAPNPPSSRRSPLRTAALPLAALVLLAGAVWWSLRVPTDEAPSPQAPAQAATEARERSFSQRWGYDDAQSPTGRVTGRVLGVDGAPAAGATVTLTRALPWQAAGPRQLPRVWSAVSGPDGRFELSAIPLGPYGVTAMAEGASSEAMPLSVEDAERPAEVDLTLRPGAVHLRGRVLATENSGVPADATVTAQAHTPAETEGGAATWRASVDGAGRFMLALPPGAYDVLVRARGHASRREAFVLAGDVEPTFHMRPAARINGRTLERSGNQRLASASVTLVGSPSALVTPETRTDITGAFTFDELDADRVQVLVRHGGLLGLSRSVAAVPGETATVEVELTPGHAVSGRVLAPDGRGASGAVVRLVANEPWFPLSAVTRAGEDGTFRFEGLLNGPYTLQAESATDARAFQTLTVRGGDVRDVALALEPTATLRGTVTSEQGRPAAGARVQLSGLERARVGSAPRQTTADAQGRFEFSAIPSGRVQLTAAHPELGALRSGPHAVTAEQATTVDLRLARPTVLSGTVREGDGRPAVGVPVLALSRESPTAPVVARTGEDGSYRLGPLAGGSTLVHVAPEGVWRQGEPHLQRTVEALPGQEQQGIDFVLSGPAQALTGTVLGPDGQPVASAVVVAVEASASARTPPSRFGARQASTLTAGTFSVETLPGRTYSLQVEHPRFPRSRLESVPAGASGITVRLPGGGTLLGEVQGTDGRPASEYTLTALEGGPPGGAAPDRAPVTEAMTLRVRDASGQFELGPLPAGLYALQVRSADGALGREQVRLGEGERKTGVRLVVKPAPSRDTVAR